MEVTDDSSTRVSVGSRRGNCSLACNRKLIPRLIAQIEEEISRARDTTRLPWRTNEPMVPRPPSSEFSSKQQVVVNTITCWLVNNEKQLQRLSLSFSFNVGREQILHKFKRWFCAPGQRGDLYARGLPGDDGAFLPTNKTKNSGTILAPFCRS